MTRKLLINSIVCIALFICMPILAEAETVLTCFYPVVGKTSSYNNFPRYNDTAKTHYGNDIQASEYTAVIAARAGTVVNVVKDNSAGNTVFIKDSQIPDIVYAYEHLSYWFVNKGDSVNAGDFIGTVGNTGHSTGAHLHLGAHWKPASSNYFNTTIYLNPCFTRKSAYPANAYQFTDKSDRYNLNQIKAYANCSYSLKFNSSAHADPLKIKYVYPKSYKISSSGWIVKGLVSSNTPIQTIKIWIENSKGEQLFSPVTKNFSSNVYFYDLHNVSSDVKFSKVSSDGIYYYCIEAIDNTNRKCSVRQQFSASSGAEAISWNTVSSNNSSEPSNPDPIIELGSDAKYPAGDLGYVSNFGLYGTISSNEKITSVQATIYDQSTGSPTTVFISNPIIINPNSTVFNINTSEINKKFTFRSLIDGSYRYEVKVTTVSGYQKTVINSEFTYGSGTEPSYLDVVAYGEYLTNETYELICDINEEIPLYVFVNAEEDVTDQVTWSSSNTSIASVNGRAMTINGFGNATITAHYSDMSASFSLMTIQAIRPVANVNISPASLNMNANEQRMLSVTVLPDNATDKSVCWFSSDYTIATVDEEGCVFAHKTGVVTITAIAKDGSEARGTTIVTVSCEHDFSVDYIIVQEPTATQEGLKEKHCPICGETISSVIIPKLGIPVSSISLNHSDITIKKSCDLQLTESVLPLTASNRNVRWESSNPSVVTVSSTGCVVAINKGTAIITCNTTDGSNLSAECSIHVWENESDLEANSTRNFVLPKELEIIENESFFGIPAVNIKIPSKIHSIGSKAFAECSYLKRVFIPATVVSIAEDAFEGAFNATIIGYRNTAAESIANDHGIPFIPLDPVETTITVPSGVSISGNETVDLGGSLVLSAMVSPSNASVQTVQWRSSDNSIAAVSSDGTVTPVAAGTVTISAISDGDTSKVAQKTITVRQPYSLAFNANGGSCSITSRTEYSGYSLGSALPAATRDYYDFDGWYTDPSGGTKVSQSSVFTGSGTVTLYAHWTIHPLSGWVQESDVPTGATIEAASWSYRESTESTEANLDGWTANGSYWRQTGTGSTNYASFPSGYDTSNTYYKTFAKAPYTASETATAKREVSNESIGYIYWHWMYNCVYTPSSTANRTISTTKQTTTAAGTSGNVSFQYFFAMASSVNCSSNGTTSAYSRPSGLETWNCSSIIPSLTTEAQRSSNTSGLGTDRFYRFSYSKSTYTDYQKVFKYYRDLSYQSSDPGTGASISNKVKYVKYRVK